jgi:hypothetical protein
VLYVVCVCVSCAFREQDHLPETVFTLASLTLCGLLASDENSEAGRSGFLFENFKTISEMVQNEDATDMILLQIWNSVRVCLCVSVCVCVCERACVCVCACGL